MTDLEPIEEKAMLEKEEVLARLRRVEGQVRGIQRMITEDRDCEAVVTQLMAARAALDRASLFVMTHHIERCLMGPSGQVNRTQLARIIGLLLKLSGPQAEPIMPED